MTLLKSEPLQDIIKSAILSAKVAREDVKPVSLFLVAPPERGKTSIALSVSDKNSLKVTDISAIGLLQCLQRNPNATHVILTDLMSVSGHRDSVKQLTISMLNALVEEGTYTIALPNMQHLDLNGRRVGVIACAVPDMLTDNRMWWIRSGFMSRLLVLQYDHAPSLTMKILKAIADHDGKESNIKKKQLPMPEIPVRVDIRQKEASDILSLSQMLAKSNDEIGYRKQKQLRSLACGHALMRTWKDARVTQEDVSWLQDVACFVAAPNKDIVRLTA